MYEATDSFGRRLKRLNINHLSFKTYSPILPSPIKEIPEVPTRSVKNSTGSPLAPIESEHVSLPRNNSVGTLLAPHSKHSPMKPSIKKKPLSLQKEAEDFMIIQPQGQEVPVENFSDKNGQLSDSRVISPIASLASIKHNPFQLKLPLNNTPKNGKASAEGSRKSPKITPRQIENPDSLKKLSMSNITQNKEPESKSQKALNLKLIGKVFEAHAMSIYSARASSSQTTRRERPRDLLKLFSPRVPHDHDRDHGSTPKAKTARSRVSPDPTKEKEKKFVNKGKFEVVKRPCKLSSDTQYDLIDRQKRKDYQIKNVRKGADLGSLEFFKKIQIDVKESMTVFKDPQFSLFRNYQKKMTSSLKLENVETIKNIVRGDVISKKPV